MHLQPKLKLYPLCAMAVMTDIVRSSTNEQSTIDFVELRRERVKHVERRAARAAAVVEDASEMARSSVHGSATVGARAGGSAIDPRQNRERS